MPHAARPQIGRAAFRGKPSAPCARRTSRAVCLTLTASPGRPASARSASSTGISTSSIVFSPTVDRPRAPTASTPAANTSAKVLGQAPAALDRRARRQERNCRTSGPEAPPTVITNVLPMAARASPVGSATMSSSLCEHGLEAPLHVRSVVAVADRQRRARTILPPPPRSAQRSGRSSRAVSKARSPSPSIQPQPPRPAPPPCRSRAVRSSVVRLVHHGQTTARGSARVMRLRPWNSRWTWV